MCLSAEADKMPRFCAKSKGFAAITVLYCTLEDHGHVNVLECCDIADDRL
jgi:hypothetical protein